MPVRIQSQRRWKVGPTRQIIGLQSGATLTVIDDASAGGETSGWTKNLDITSYSFGAVVSLVNGTGATRTIANVILRGKPVYMLQGNEGIIHDSFVDHDSIFENGEHKVEWGNDYVVEVNQTNKIADFLWKEFRGRKHWYALTLPGTRYNYEPDDWYRLQIGGSGQIEYIDSVVRVFQVETYRRADELGTTQVLLKEVEEAWKKDSTAVARFIASGMTYQIPAQVGGIRIGSQYTTDKCDIYCDGTSDEDEINQAISDLSARYNGGTVHLSRGTFNIDSAISLKSGISLQGEGKATIIHTANGTNSISVDGSSGSEIIGVVLKDLKIEGGTTVGDDAIYCNYADDITIENIIIDGCQDGLYMINCDGIKVSNIVVYQAQKSGCQFLSSCTGLNGNNITVNGQQVRNGIGVGIAHDAANSTLSNIIIKDLYSNGSGVNLIGLSLSDSADHSEASGVSISNLDHDNTGGARAQGVECRGSDCTVAGLNIDNVNNSGSASLSDGLWITGDRNNFNGVNVQNCSGQGVAITSNGDRNTISGITYNNGTNLNDQGSNSNTTALISA